MIDPGIINRVTVSLGPKLVRVRVLGLSAVGSIVGALAASVACASSSGAGLQVGRALAASVRADVVAAGTFRTDRQLGGAATAGSGTAGDLTVVRGLAATISANTGVVAVLSAGGGFDARSQSSCATAGTLTVARPLASPVNASTAVTASLRTTLSLSGASLASSTAQATITVTRPLSASLPSAGTATGALSVSSGLDGTSAATSLATATITVARRLNASAVANSLIAGDLTVTRGLAASVATNSLASGTLTIDTQALALPGAPLAVFPMRKYKVYTGPYARVRRETDNVETDISVNGNAFDLAAAQTFAGPLTRLAVTTMYDATGNGNHATNTNPATQPLLQLDRLVNGLPVITFDGTGSGATRVRYLDLPASLSPDRAATSMFFMGALNCSKQKAAAWEFSASSIAFTPHTNPADVGFQVYNGNTSHISGIQPPVNPMVLGVVSGAASDTIYVADKSDTRAGGLGAQSLPGGRIGGSLAGAGYNGQQDMYAFVVYGSALSASDVALVQSGAKAAFRFGDNFTKQVVFDGDSITEGYGAPGLRNYVNNTIPALNSKARAYNLGVFGQTFAAARDDGVARVDSLYSASFSAKVLSAALGSNDFAANSSATAVRDIFIDYCATRRAKGFKIVAHTVLPRADYTGAQEAQRVGYNTWLRANYATYADALGDWAADAVLGPTSATADTSIYGDGTHPTESMHKRLATITTAAINSVL